MFDHNQQFSQRFKASVCNVIEPEKPTLLVAARNSYTHWRLLSTLLIQ